jgi:hypothetical protein
MTTEPTPATDQAKAAVQAAREARKYVDSRTRIRTSTRTVWWYTYTCSLTHTLTLTQSRKGTGQGGEKGTAGGRATRSTSHRSGGRGSVSGRERAGSVRTTG